MSRCRAYPRGSKRCCVCLETQISRAMHEAVKWIPSRALRSPHWQTHPSGWRLDGMTEGPVIFLLFCCNFYNARLWRFPPLRRRTSFCSFTGTSRTNLFCDSYWPDFAPDALIVRSRERPERPMLHPQKKHTSSRLPCSLKLARNNKTIFTTYLLEVMPHFIQIDHFHPIPAIREWHSGLKASDLNQHLHNVWNRMVGSCVELVPCI